MRMRGLLALFFEDTETTADDDVRLVRSPAVTLGDHSRDAYVTVLRSVRVLGGTRQRTAVIALKARVATLLGGPGTRERAAFVTEWLGAQHAISDACSEPRVINAVRSDARALGDAQRQAFATTLRRARATFTLTRQAVIVDG